MIPFCVIPFSAGVNVRLEDHDWWLSFRGGPFSGWFSDRDEAFTDMLEVRLNYHGRKRWQKGKIAQTTNTNDMENLANEIGRFIGK
jgi:hypothetical protein